MVLGILVPPDLSECELKSDLHYLSGKDGVKRSLGSQLKPFVLPIFLQITSTASQHLLPAVPLSPSWPPSRCSGHQRCPLPLLRASLCVWLLLSRTLRSSFVAVVLVGPGAEQAAGDAMGSRGIFVARSGRGGKLNSQRTRQKNYTVREGFAKKTSARAAAADPAPAPSSRFLVLTRGYVPLLPRSCFVLS